MQETIEPPIGITEIHDFYLGKKWSAEPVYMGSFKKQFGTLHRQLVNATVLTEEDYFKLKYSKNVFCAEAPYRMDEKEWTYEKNQAFWAGAISVGRKFILLNPISDYLKCFKLNYASYTLIELLWLSDNGYCFKEDKSGRLCAISPTNVPQSTIIRDYAAMTNEGKVKHKELEEALKDLLNKIPQQLLNQRSVEQNSDKENLIFKNQGM